MGTVTSKDGTRIAFDRTGSGPAVILVDGAMCYRASGPMAPIAKLLAPRYTVFTYDRRGRGESTNVQPYSVAREVEDLQALIAEAGGSALVCGLSSGAALALEAAHQGAADQQARAVRGAVLRRRFANAAALGFHLAPRSGRGHRTSAAKRCRCS